MAWQTDYTQRLEKLVLTLSEANTKLGETLAALQHTRDAIPGLLSTVDTLQQTVETQEARIAELEAEVAKGGAMTQETSDAIEAVLAQAKANDAALHPAAEPVLVPVPPEPMVEKAP